MPINLLKPNYSVDLSSPALGGRFFPLDDLPLKETPFRSRATWSYATGRDNKFIAFADRRPLQASELNELEEIHATHQSLQLRFNANWKNSTYSTIPSWTGLIPIDPKNIVVQALEPNGDTVRIKLLVKKGWYLSQRKSFDFLNRWIYLSNDVSGDFTYTNISPLYTKYIGFEFHSFRSQCLNVGTYTLPDGQTQELKSSEYRDNSQDYETIAENENTCGADRGACVITTVDQRPEWTEGTDQTTFGFSNSNLGGESVQALLKLVRTIGDNYEIRFVNDLLIQVNSDPSTIFDLELSDTKIFESSGDSVGNFSVTYGTWQTSGLSPAEGGIVATVNEGGSVTFENGYAIISTKRAGVPAERSGQITSTNSRAELRIEGNYTAPFTSTKMVLGYQKFDTRLKARVKVESALVTHLFIVGLYKTHAIDYGEALADPNYAYFYGPGNERIIGFVNTLVDNTPTWTCVVMDGCYGNHRGYTNPNYSSYEIFPTNYSCLDEHLLEVYMNKEETIVQFKVDGQVIKTYQNPNGLLCKQPRPRDAANKVQRTLQIGCSVRDTANTPYDSQIEGVMRINEISATIRSVAPFESLSYPQFWNS